jgi:hypothetical protein
VKGVEALQSASHRRAFKPIAINLPQTVRSKRTEQLEESRKLLILWCRGRDSNPHGLLGQRILSPLRLPFRHPGIF